MNKPSDDEMREAIGSLETSIVHGIPVRMDRIQTLLASCQELLELRAKVKELEKDKERLDWRPPSGSCIHFYAERVELLFHGESITDESTLRLAIDAAMKKGD